MFKLIAILATLFSFTHQLFEPPDIWATPVPYFEVRQEFKAPISLHGPGHRGVDFLIESDAEIQAPTGGAVHFAGKVVDDYYLTIRTLEGLLISFSDICTTLTEGQSVKVGQVIGVPCDAASRPGGHCEACSHLSVRSDYGYLNPELFFGLVKPSILKS
ncbi:MAG: hypothetical protein P8M68_05800 [Aquiluna sp.]|nr:hypothetical protein [Aquiluna sp.]